MPTPRLPMVPVYERSVKAAIRESAQKITAIGRLVLLCSTMGHLAEEIQRNKEGIRDQLHVGYAIWDDLAARVERQESSPKSDFYDEQIWTFLVACAYALGSGGAAHLARALVGETQPVASHKIWFETLPDSPRVQEGNTRVDLAVGAIKLRPGTQSGIEFDRDSGTWIALCECKWYSDIDTRVSYDLHRNQLLRVIENALCFQGSGAFPERVHAVLVTPAVFRERAIKSRLYQYKLHEYRSDPATMLDELSSCCLRRSAAYPVDLNARLKSLKLSWVTYQELLRDAPESALREPLLEFVKVSDGSHEHC